MILPRSRHFVPLALLAGLLSAAAPAAAQDVTDIATAKSRVVAVKALGDSVLVISDRPRNKPHRIQRVVDGRLAGTSGLQRSGILFELEHPGRDRAGRVVIPFRTAKRMTSDDRLVGLRWFLYDVERNTAKRLRGLPGNAAHVAVWRSRIAFTRDGGKRAGVYLRDRDGTERISRRTIQDFDDPLVLRGRTLVMVSGAGDGTYTVNRIVDGGERCVAAIEPSTGEADGEFVVSRVWLTGQRVSWLAEISETAGNLVLGTDLKGDCTDPEPVGAYPATEELPLALDGDDLYTADGRRIQRRDAGEPSTAAPANDTVAGAVDISAALPLVVGARIGFATVTPDEPAVTGRATTGGTANATRTIWYAYKPTTAGSVKITARSEYAAVRDGDLPQGAFSVYDDPGTGTLTELPEQAGELTESVTFNADPTHRYLIGLGCDSALPCWPAVTLSVEAG